MKYLIFIGLFIIIYVFIKNKIVNNQPMDASKSAAAQANNFVDKATNEGHKIVNGIDTTTGEPPVPEIVNGVKLTYLERVRLSKI